MSDLTPKGFSDGQYVDRYLLRDKLYAEDAITMKGVAILNKFPAADVVEVVRGKWEMNSNYPDRFICSECGAQFDCWHWEAKQMHYCPSCGAKMDGGQDDV